MNSFRPEDGATKIKMEMESARKPVSRARALARQRDVNKEWLKAALIALFVLFALATQIMIEAQMR